MLRSYRTLSGRLLNGWALPPLTAVIILTNECRLRCVMCRLPRECRDEMTTREVLRILEQLPRNCLVLFTGGDPMTRDDFGVILEQAAPRHRIALQTNGIVNRPVSVESLISYGARYLFGRGLITCEVSVQGVGSVHDKICRVRGAFDQVSSWMRSFSRVRDAMRREYPLLTQRTVIHPDNYRELEDIFLHGAEAGADTCNFQILNTGHHHEHFIDKDSDEIDRLIHEPVAPAPMLEIGVLRDQIRRLHGLSEKTGVRLRFSPWNFDEEEIIRHYQNRSDHSDWSCLSPFSTMGITPRGDVLLCEKFFHVGNIREEGDYRSAWNSDRAREVRRLVAGAGSFQGCRGCCSLELKRGAESR